MPVVSLPAQHPQRASLHNEIHARPPESIAAPTALTHLVMVCDSAQRLHQQAQRLQATVAAFRLASPPLPKLAG